MKRYVLYSFFIVIILSAIFSYLKAGKARHEDTGLKEFEVKRGEVHETIEATGEIKPATGAQISLGARVTGTVVKEPISVGDRVKKGDLIAIIDNRELKEDVVKAEAELSRIKVHYANLIREKKLRVDELTKEYDSSLLEVKKAQSEYDFRKWNFQSMKGLFESKNHSVSERSFREARNQLVQAGKSLKQARDKKEAARLSLEQARVALARLKKEFYQDEKKAKAELAKAKIRLSYSVLRAPFSGVITYVSTQEGETVVAGLNAPQFVKILDESRVENWIYIDETDIGHVSAGMTVTFSVDAYPQLSLRGKIEKIYPAPVIQNNVVYYIAVVRIVEHTSKLHLKMTTHNRIHVRTVGNVLVVPNSAVKFMDGHYVVKLKGAKGDGYVKVEVGVSDDAFTEIKKGLKEGDVVLYKS